MIDILIKSVVGGIIIGIVSTLAQKNPTAGAFIMGIPIVSFITLTIMYYSGVDYETMRVFSYETCFFVVLSLSFFPVYVWLFPLLGFWFSLLSGATVAGSLMFLATKLL